ncbi:hypothetical protein [Pseudomonas synxantha]|nr:hypothetical protein [Pseudomonas synxantha]
MKKARPARNAGIQCGRGLAPDSSVSFTASVTDPALSGASPLPHLVHLPSDLHQARTGHFSSTLSYIPMPTYGLPTTGSPE